MRTSVWAEIQDAVRGPHAIPRGESEAVDEHIVKNWMGQIVMEIHVPRYPGCQLCGCHHDVHSKTLPFAPCLDCDCIGWTQ